MATSRTQLHFLLVSLPNEGMLTPTRRLASRLARLSGAHITIATPLSSHRRLFPNSTSSAGEPDDTAQGHPLNPDGSGIISYAPYSDGFDDGFDALSGQSERYISNLKSIGSGTVAALTSSLAARGRPVTCIVYSILLTWVADIAREIGVPAVLFWIQPASLYAIYYHFFRGHHDFSSSLIELPGLPPLRTEELPSILAAPSPFRSPIGEIYAEIGRSEKKERVLVNTFGELETAVMEGVPEVEMVAVGPMVGEEFEKEGDEELMEWLESQEKGSVVYVAFGSFTRPAARQMEEIARGLKVSGRPYLWVQRKDGRSTVEEVEEQKGEGMVVEWCTQVRVLGHRAVGCFVTHCGWNSMTEAMASGVPVVMMPEWMDQPANAALAEKAWGVGVRPEVAEDGVVKAAEMERCIRMVMGEGERGKEIRRRAEEWKEKAVEAVAEDGSSTRNLRDFLEGLVSK